MSRYEMPRMPVVVGYPPLVLPCTQNTNLLRLVVYGGASGAIWDERRRLAASVRNSLLAV